MKALFIGRFQPFHKGHLKSIQYILKRYDEIIIGIGSSQYSHTVDNPFTSDERIEMIKLTLKSKNITNFKIILIPDIHNPPKWVDHILEIYSDFDVVVTNSNLTKQLFLDKGCKVIETPVYSKEKYSGRVIRNKIAKNKDWKDCVPSEVVDIIKKIDGVNRIKNLT
jgi:nicotinamide-nucleotide adenylyltransferase